MTENEHFIKAKSRLHNGTTNEVNRAQAEATLALAYEQRTANLIALYGMCDADVEALAAQAEISPSDWESIARQIKERLGL